MASSEPSSWVIFRIAFFSAIELSTALLREGAKLIASALYVNFQAARGGFFLQKNCNDGPAHLYSPRTSLVVLKQFIRQLFDYSETYRETDF